MNEESNISNLSEGEKPSTSIRGAFGHYYQTLFFPVYELLEYYQEQPLISQRIKQLLPRLKALNEEIFLLLFFPDCRDGTDEKALLSDSPSILRETAQAVREPDIAAILDDQITSCKIAIAPPNNSQDAAIWSFAELGGMAEAAKRLDYLAQLCESLIESRKNSPQDEEQARSWADFTKKNTVGSDTKEPSQRSNHPKAIEIDPVKHAQVKAEFEKLYREVAEIADCHEIGNQSNAYEVEHHPEHKGSAAPDKNILLDQYSINTSLGVEVAQAVHQRLHELGVPFDNLSIDQRMHFMRDPWMIAKAVLEEVEEVGNPDFLVSESKLMAARANQAHLANDVLMYYFECLKADDGTGRPIEPFHREMPNGEIREYDLHDIHLSIIHEI
jgi:hypothetical protein